MNLFIFCMESDDKQNEGGKIKIVKYGVVESNYKTETNGKTLMNWFNAQQSIGALKWKKV